MKKLLSLMGLIAASVMTANAQIVDTKVQTKTNKPRPFPEYVVSNISEYAFFCGVSDGGKGMNPKYYIYNDNLELVKEFNTENVIAFEYLSSKWYADEESLVLTQTVFNNDEKFEYLSRIEGQVGNDSDGDPIIKTTGFMLINDEGETLQRVDFPNGLYLYYEIAILDLDGKKYITCKLDDTSYNSYQVIYRINKGGGSGVFTLACDPIKVDASPRMASKSEPITVTFDSDAVTRIEVVNVRGAVEQAFEVEAGAHSAIVDTSRLGKGMYIIHVVADGVRSENCKVIIR